MKHFPAILIGLLLALPAAIQATEPPPSRFQHFITRQGDKLYDGDKEFRFIGANMPGLVVPYDWTLFLPERMNLPRPWEQEDGFKTLDQMNLRVVRTWNLPIREPNQEPQPWHYVLGPGQFNEQAFLAVDHLFALANKYGVRVIFDLTAEAGDYLGGVGMRFGELPVDLTLANCMLTYVGDVPEAAGKAGEDYFFAAPEDIFTANPGTGISA